MSGSILSSPPVFLPYSPNFDELRIPRNVTSSFEQPRSFGDFQQVVSRKDFPESRPRLTCRPGLQETTGRTHGAAYRRSNRARRAIAWDHLQQHHGLGHLDPPSSYGLADREKLLDNPIKVVPGVAKLQVVYAEQTRRGHAASSWFHVGVVSPFC